MTTITQTITNPSPEKLRAGDYVTLRRMSRTNTPPVSVRGTVHRWDPVYADWLTLAGWPNQRFAVDGPDAAWTIDRIARQLPAPAGVPFTTGTATVNRRVPGERRDVRRPHRERGVFIAGRFYGLGADGRPLPPTEWSDFQADPS